VYLPSRTARRQKPRKHCRRDGLVACSSIGKDSLKRESPVRRTNTVVRYVQKSRVLVCWCACTKTIALGHQHKASEQAFLRVHNTEMWLHERHVFVTLSLTGYFSSSTVQNVFSTPTARTFNLDRASRATSGTPESVCAVAWKSPTARP
jgi:hypothetical protein